jgi:hypothetical protein
LSKKNLSAGCAVFVANEISDMGALSKLIFGGDGEVYDGNNWVHAEPATL